MPLATGDRLAVGISITARRAMAALAAVMLLSACSESTAETEQQFAPLVLDAATTTRASARTTVAEQPLAPWTERRFSEPAPAGAVRSCIEVTTRETTASSCPGPTGVSSWTIAGQHFVFARGDLVLSDGSTIRAGTDGIAIGVLPRNALPVGDTSPDCNRHDIAAAVAEHYPDSAPAWIASRCADDQLAAADVQLADRTAVIALIERHRAGGWEVIATFRAPVRCALLDMASRVKCKLLRFDD